MKSLLISIVIKQKKYQKENAFIFFDILIFFCQFFRKVSIISILKNVKLTFLIAAKNYRE